MDDQSNPIHMVNMHRHLILSLLLALPLSFFGAQVQAQDASEASFTQVTRPVAQLNNQAAIDDLLGELLIAPQIPQDSINRVEVIDVTNNGYGPDDLVVIYPSGETFNIEPSLVSGRVQEIMSSWVQESEFQIDAANAPPDAFRPFPLQSEAAEPDTVEADTTAAADTTGEADTTGSDTTRTQPELDRDQLVGREIMADVLETVQRNYNGNSISLLLERNEDGFTMEMWDYDPDAMQYEAPPTGPPDTVRTRDVVYVVRSDSVIYDVVYINKTVKETEYVPQGPTSSVSPSEEDDRARERIIRRTSESERR